MSRPEHVDVCHDTSFGLLGYDCHQLNNHFEEHIRRCGMDGSNQVCNGLSWHHMREIYKRFNFAPCACVFTKSKMQVGMCVKHMFADHYS